MKVVINPGHGQMNSGVVDPGAIGPTGYKEMIQNMEIGSIVADKLRKNGWDVLLIQDGDLWDVTNAANGYNADYFISIHADSFSDPSAHGITTYIQGTGGTAERIAKEVQKELIAATGLTDRGVKVSNLHVTRETTMPAILVEAGFISNPNEESLMKQATYDEEIAVAICKGFSRSVNVAFVDDVPVIATPVQPRADYDIYLSVRCYKTLAPQAIKDINKLGFAAKVMDLA